MQRNEGDRERERERERDGIIASTIGGLSPTRDRRETGTARESVSAKK